jgi:choline-sulfatase
VRARWVAAAIVAVGATAAVVTLRGRREFPLPERIALEQAIADLSGAFARTAVVEEPAPDAVRPGGLQPGFYLAVAGGYRQAIVAPPPSRLRFTARVPPGSTLRFGIGVEKTAKREQRPVGVRFAVTVDGRERFARVVNSIHHDDQRWFDEEVALGVDTERELEIGLETRSAGDGPVVGTPGWSHVRVVQERSYARRPAATDAPNVLLLLVDTFRRDRLGCYGARPSPSPTLDALALRGLVFEQAVAQAPWTMPSVATILTGLYPQSHGMVAGQHPGAGALAGHVDADTAFLPDGVATLAEHAERGGVTTVGVSANPIVSRDTNLARGFETFVEFGMDQARQEWVAAPRVNDAFLRWLGEHRGHRFLAYLHYMDTHDPYTPPAAFRPAPPPGVRPQIAAGNVAPLALQINRHGAPPLPAVEVDYLRALYDGEIRGWDAALGELLTGLERLGVEQSTLVVVVADHGEEFQDHGRLKHGIDLYDELIHVPLVIAGPGVVPGRTAVPAQGIDLFPTVAAALGLPAPPGLPGQNLLGTPVARPAFADTRYGVAADGGALRLIAVRTPGWKLIQAPDLGRTELYDLTHDPGEHQDRSGAADGAALATELARWEATVPPPPPVAGRDPRLLEKLRALGYVE